jgi:hypothetical protein
MTSMSLTAEDRYDLLDLIVRADDCVRECDGRGLERPRHLDCSGGVHTAHHRSNRASSGCPECSHRPHTRQSGIELAVH